MTAGLQPDRRGFALGCAVTALAAALGVPGRALAQALGTAFTADGTFTRSTVAEIAQALAAVPYEAPDETLPETLQDLTAEQYRSILFRPEASIWAGEALPFQMQLFHRGFAFATPVEVAIVEDGEARHIPYDSERFAIGPSVTAPPTTDDIGYSGIRLLGPLSGPGATAEVAVFQGASYFRSLGRGQTYGLSARGLALRTGDPAGEEFPIFRAFWVETPVPESEAVVVHALLDSPSTTGAYRFTIRPGLPTLMDVEVQLFPRVDLTQVGLAPGTSMFLFSAADRGGVDDYRPEVHDSDGLLMVTGRGERVWRPLSNPSELQLSAFIDVSPRGFGLMQRNRDFDRYQDVETAFQRRPSLWMEPLGDWGAGAVVLVEIPSGSEVNDNIVAYWSPRNGIAAGAPYSYAYRMLWGEDTPLALGSAFVGASRAGLSASGTGRVFVIDYLLASGVDIQALGQARAEVTASRGAVDGIVLQQNPATGGWRLRFTLEPADETLVELRAVVTFAGGAPAETWVHRWTP